MQTGGAFREASDLPNVDPALFNRPAPEQLAKVATSTRAPRILLLYGFLRKRSFSRLQTFEAQRLLNALGAETRVFAPEGLPLPDGHPEDHPKVRELCNLATWYEGMVWTSPERHGAMTGIIRAQIDWIPLSIGSVRPPRASPLR
jgi:arsenic resistance protein ArsH